MKTFSPQILDENRRRNAALACEYDPIRGIGCHQTPESPRVQVDTPVPGLPSALVPYSMIDDPLYPTVVSSPIEWQKLRCRHDFEYWCARVVHIKDKLSGRDIPFTLNYPQRKVLAVLEGDRLADRPIRLIILKARQWGGSTLVQMYMAWIQSCLRRNWNSIICAHVKDTAAAIRGMYTNMLASYPTDLWEGDADPAFKPFERAINVRSIAGRGCRVTIASAENQEAMRGTEFAMAHLSETAFWPATAQRSPADLVRSVCSAVALVPLSLIAMESTANGVGSYFHREWLRCKNGTGDKHAVFIPWYDIEIYRMHVADPEALWRSLTDYEYSLWERGCTLEMIAWYHSKAAEYPSLEQMHAEFPTDDSEAFINSGTGIFSRQYIDRMRLDCRRPAHIGDIDSTVDKHTGIAVDEFHADDTGALAVWQQPMPGETYLACVDIGGRTARSDWSVIAVFKRDFRNSAAEERPEIVAQWRGHIDHDLLAEKAMAIARYFNNALLVIESNSWEKENSGGDPELFILNRIARAYSNVYRRGAGDDAHHIGFHTNRSTKGMIVANLIREVRSALYIERCDAMCDELATYEMRPNGSYAAKDGCHDDILMTRAIALHIMRADRRPCFLPMPMKQNLPQW